MNEDLSPDEKPVRCAALPYRVRDGVVELLLISRRGRKGWLIPKGKLDDDLDPGETARYHAMEKAGVEGEVSFAPFDEYRHGGSDDDPRVRVFLLRVTRELPSWPQANQRERCWMPAAKAAGAVRDRGLARVLAAAAAHLTARLHAAPGIARPAAPPPPPPLRRLGMPIRFGLALLAIVLTAAAVSALLGRKDVRGAAAFNSVSASPRGPDAAASAAAEDSLCRVDGASVELPRRLSEASGIAVGRRVPGVLWSHNDSGQPVVYAFSADGSSLGEVRVAGASVKDWEDVAAASCPDGSCLYLADIGDNTASRTGITVFRIPEPAATDSVSRLAEAFNAAYPDGPHDAEALFVLPDGGIHIVTKGETGPIAIYRFPQPLRAGASVTLEKVVTLGSATRRRDRITGASASPDGRWVALRTLDALDLYRTAELLRGGATPRRTDLRPLGEAQGEGVGWGTSGALFLSSEGGGKHRPGTLGRVSCSPGG